MLEFSLRQMARQAVWGVKWTVGAIILMRTKIYNRAMTTQVEVVEDRPSQQRGKTRAIDGGMHDDDETKIKPSGKETLYAYAKDTV